MPAVLPGTFVPVLPGALVPVAVLPGALLPVATLPGVLVSLAILLGATEVTAPVASVLMPAVSVVVAANISEDTG